MAHRENSGKLSIIVVTIDAPPLVERLFTSLMAQTCKDFDILLVHGPTISVAAARELAANFPALDITVLQSVDTCLSRSRNLALNAATGAIIAFADDDCIYEPGTVAGVLAAFEKNSAAQAIMGRSVGIGEPIRPQADVPVALDRYGVFKDCPSYVHFYRAQAVQAIGQFDEHLGVGCSTPYLSGEETDYALRALAAKFSIMRVPSIIVRHPAVNLRNPALPAKVRAYAAGRMRLLHKHNLPIWFILANVVYPLFRLPLDCLAECLLVTRYRWTMFTSRLAWLRRAK